jgi:hypothetical protein
MDGEFPWEPVYAELLGVIGTRARRGLSVWHGKSLSAGCHHPHQLLCHYFMRIPRLASNIVPAGSGPEVKFPLFGPAFFRIEGISFFALFSG